MVHETSLMGKQHVSTLLASCAVAYMQRPGCRIVTRYSPQNRAFVVDSSQFDSLLANYLSNQQDDLSSIKLIVSQSCHADAPSG